MVLELERAERVRDALDRVRQRMRVVVHRVDAPRVAGAVVVAWRMRYSTGSRMFMFGDAMSIFARSTCAPSGNSPARMRANRSRFSSTGRSRYGLSRPGSVSVPRYSRISSARRDRRRTPCPSRSAARRSCRAARSSPTRRSSARRPLEAEPAHVALDRVDVLDVFLGRVRVVEAEVAASAVLLRDAEVEADRLGVADVRGSRWAPAGTASRPSCRRPVRRSSSMMSRMKSSGAAAASVFEPVIR